RLPAAAADDVVVDTELPREVPLDPSRQHGARDPQLGARAGDETRAIHDGTKTPEQGRQRGLVRAEIEADDLYAEGTQLCQVFGILLGCAVRRPRGDDDGDRLSCCTNSRRQRAQHGHPELTGTEHENVPQIYFSIVACHVDRPFGAQSRASSSSVNSAAIATFFCLSVMRSGSPLITQEPPTEWRTSSAGSRRRLRSALDTCRTLPPPCRRR